MIVACINNGRLFGKSEYGFYAIGSLPIIDEKLVFDNNVYDLSGIPILMNTQLMYDGLHATNLVELNLRNLTKVFGDIYLQYIDKYDFTSLKDVEGKFTLKNDKVLYLPNLQSIDSIVTEEVDEILLPSLNKCGVIYSGNCKKISTPANCIILCDENTDCDCPNATIYRGFDYRLVKDKVYKLKSKEEFDNYSITLLEDIENSNKLYCLESDNYYREYATSKEEVIQRYQEEKGEINADNIG